ncbi:MAG: methyltransferase domain-containing protein [Thiobacillus sp.]|nr:methyltransferase domain-containing protein [Thiobacillus sp.]
MATRDPHRFVNELDEAALERLIARLESRAQDAVFARLFDKYVVRLPLPPSARVLEVGCGTGAMLRSLARRDDFTGKALGVDQCSHFIEAASQFAQAENISDRLTFKVGDAHCLDFPPATFDVVIAHTLISHVTEPAMVLSEMARVVRPGGTVVIFDGDYASLTYAFPDHGFGHQMDVALASATFNNPRIMRDLPRLLPELGLKLTAAWGDAVVEIGNGSYFKSFVETYVPYVMQAGLLPAQAVDVWLNEQRQAMENGTFFAACNYYTYLARRT